MPINFDQSRAHKVLLMQAAAQAQKERSIENVSRLLTSGPQTSGGTFVRQRAHEAAGYRPFTISESVQARYDKMMKGMK